MKRYRETVALVLLLILGMAPRFAMVTRYPTIPVSDFNSLVAAGVHLRDLGLIGNGSAWFWEYFNPGLPLVLCGLFHIFTHVDPGTVARLATAVACGLLPILPFFIWRGVLPLWARIAAGAALALWPGQILFSGVVAQDNWVLLPSVALATLAVRSLFAKEPARLVTAGLVFGAGVAMRQEMLVVLFPLFLVAAGVNLRAGWRRVVAAGLAAGLPLLALAAYRYQATGRFALSSPHAGTSILGAYIPSATANGWTDPYPYVASVRPDLLRDHKALLSQSSGLAFREALRRPGFQTVRILSSVINLAIVGEAASLYWSIGEPETLPEADRGRGSALVALAGRPLLFELAAIQGLFLAAVIFGIWRRNMAILVLAAAVLLKYGLHAVTVAQGRYFFVATAFEILAIALAAYEVRTVALPNAGWRLAGTLTVGAVFSWGLFQFAPRLAAFVESRDVDSQRTYHFVLEPPDGSAALSCMVDRGLLATLEFPLRATIRTLQRDPAPGDAAVALCELSGSGVPRPLLLQVLDPYAPGGLGGRMIQRVELDGAEVFSQDIAQEPRSGWANIALGQVGTGTKRRVAIEVKAIRPDPGAGWGDAARTTFRLSSLVSHLAMGRPAAQSSTLSVSPNAGAREAIDGNTDGNFYNGSVTHTNLEANPWWQVDLGASTRIRSIVIWNRTDCCSERLSDYWVFVSDTPFRATDTPATLKSRPGTWSSHQTAAPHPSVKIAVSGAPGRYLRVQLSGTNSLSLAEVQVFGQ